MTILPHGSDLDRRHEIRNTMCGSLDLQTATSACQEICQPSLVIDKSETLARPFGRRVRTCHSCGYYQRNLRKPTGSLSLSRILQLIITIRCIVTISWQSFWCLSAMRWGIYFTWNFCHARYFCIGWIAGVSLQIAFSCFIVDALRTSNNMEFSSG